MSNIGNDPKRNVPPFNSSQAGLIVLFRSPGTRLFRITSTRYWHRYSRDKRTYPPEAEALLFDRVQSTYPDPVQAVDRWEFEDISGLRKEIFRKFEPARRNASSWFYLDDKDLTWLYQRLGPPLRIEV